MKVNKEIIKTFTTALMLTFFIIIAYEITDIVMIILLPFILTIMLEMTYGKRDD